MIIKTWRDPYDAGFSPTKPKEIELKPGLTVLVGCNGAGKTTLLRNIKEHCDSAKIPCMMYDNLHDGGSNSVSSLFYSGDYATGVSLWSSSEGECIKLNVGRNSANYKEFIQNGYVNDADYRLRKLFAGQDENTIDVIDSKDRVFLFDAVDSGMSVDAVVEIKALFSMMIDDKSASDRNLYIIIAANEYELARNSACFDVNAGRYIQFQDYEDYRKFIIKSRKLKETRLNQQKKWRENQKQKELKKYQKVLARQIELLAPFKKKYGEDLENVYGCDKYRIEDIQRSTKDFIRHSRFLTEEDVKDI